MLLNSFATLDQGDKPAGLEMVLIANATKERKGTTPHLQRMFS
jgi:hypothetical protein